MASEYSLTYTALILIFITNTLSYWQI